MPTTSNFLYNVSDCSKFLVYQLPAKKYRLDLKGDSPNGRMIFVLRKKFFRTVVGTEHRN